MMFRLVRAMVLASVFLTAGFGITPQLKITNNRDLGTSSIGPYSLQLNATGGTGSYTWSVAEGSILPPGINIAPLPGNTSQTGLVGVATCAGCTGGGGTYTFSLTVTDSSSNTVTQPFEIRFTTLTLQDTNLPDVFAGKSFSYTFTALNPLGGKASFDAARPSLPVGLTLSSTGVLSGTVPYPGTYSVDISINDGTDEIFRNFNLTVYQIGFQAISPFPLGVFPNAVQGESYSETLTAFGGTEPYTFTVLGGLPDNLSLSSGGVLSSPAVNTSTGVYGFTVQVTDAAGNAYQKTMSIDVVPGGINQMQISPGSFTDPTFGAGYSLEIGNCCGGVAPFTWTATGLPAGLSIRTGSGVTSDYVAPGQGEIWGVPTAAPGTYQVTAIITDANKNTAAVTFPLHISPLQINQNGAPQGGQINESYSFPFQVIGGTLPYTAVQVVNGALPDGLSINTTNLATGLLSISGTPLENGNFNASIKVTDSAANTLTEGEGININSPNEINISNNPVAVTPVGSSAAGDQFNACCDSSNSFTWSVVSGNFPTGVTYSSTTGQLSGTFSTAGTYVFLLEAADPDSIAAPGFKQFTVIVTPIDITTNANSLPSGNVDTAYDQVLAATQGEGSTGSLTWSVSYGYYLPPGLTLQTNGTLNGTPTQTGQYHFQVTVKDGDGNEATQSYNINIYGKSQVPPLSVTNGPNLGTWNTGTDWIGLGVSGGSGTYTYGLASGTLPTGLFLSSAVPSFFPSNQQAGLIGVATVPGTYKFSIKITSAGQPYGGTTVTVPYQLTITALNLQDVTPPDGFVGQSYSYQFTPLRNQGTVNFSVGCNGQGCSTPPGLSLSGSGALSGTPTTPGSYQITVCINDGVTGTCPGYNLQVYALQITTSPQLPYATQNSAYSGVTLSASGGSGTYTFQIVGGGLPAGMSMNSSGDISGTPTSGPGLYALNVEVIDTANNANTGYLHMSLDLVPASNPEQGMRITSTWLEDAVFGNRYGALGTVCCGGVGPFTWTVSGLPTGLTYEPSANSYNNYGSTPGDVQIYGIPEETGTFNVTLTVTDSNSATTSLVFPMHVSILDAVVGNTGNEFGLPNGTIGSTYSTSFRVLGGSGSAYTVAQTPNGEMPDGLKFSGLTLSGTPLESGSVNQELVFEDSAHNTLSRVEGIFIDDVNDVNLYLNGNGWFGFDMLSTPANTAFSTQFNACCDGPYTWSVPKGSTLPAGLTLNPSTGQLSGTTAKLTSSDTYTFLIQATNSSNSAQYGVKSYTLTVTPLTITPTSLSNGTNGTAYNQTLTATGGKGTLTWSMPFNEGSALPPGMSLSSSGVLSGTPTSTGTYVFTVQVTDSSKNTAYQPYALYIASE